MSDLTTDAIDHAAHVVQCAPADELPVFGRCWTLTVTDDEVVIRIARAAKKVNGTKLPRQPIKPPSQPKPIVHPKPPPKPKEDQ